MTEVQDPEPLMSDRTLWGIEDRLRHGFRIVPEDTVFATMIQEPTFVVRDDEEGYLPEMAVFFIRSKHPMMPGYPDIVTHGTCEKRHYDSELNAGLEPGLKIFHKVLEAHLDTLQSMREIIR